MCRLRANALSDGLSLVWNAVPSMMSGEKWLFNYLNALGNNGTTKYSHARMEMFELSLACCINKTSINILGFSHNFKCGAAELSHALKQSSPTECGRINFLRSTMRYAVFVSFASPARETGSFSISGSNAARLKRVKWPTKETWWGLKRKEKMFLLCWLRTKQMENEG